MASWAKNQIAKQLAKFAKNLDPSSLSLKFFKGEGELTNLELDETVLSDILEFPPWLQLTKVVCNRISAKVPWTSLKSDPIRLILDCVDVEIVASETAREKSANLPVFGAKANAKPTKYGFSEKVVDGMYVSINTLLVSFKSLGFKASVSISHIIVQSTMPDWKQSNNLRQTRIKDDERDEVLNFKEIRWGTMKVNADAAYKAESKEIPSTPLRLITNNSAIRLVIKKRMSDCSMLASKLIVILDDILWVLTRSQILKLSSFIHYLIKLRRKFLPIAHQSATLQQKPDETNPSLAAASSSNYSASHNQVFSAYDLLETSIHLRTQRVDLHLCDDSALDGNQPKKNGAHKGKNYGYDEPGAALQISLVNISLDHCPYHMVGTKRTAVKSDDEVSYNRKRWATQLMNNFQETEGKHWAPKRNTASLLRQNVKKQRRYVMYESCFVVNCQDFDIMQVTTSRTLEPKPFLSSEKESLFLPKEVSALHVDHTTYYYTEDETLLVPAPNVYLQVNPVQLIFDPLTCVWMNRFAQSVITGLDWTKEFMSREVGFVEHINIRVEALMPKVVLPFENDPNLPHGDERPTKMQLQISQAVISNCRVGGKSCQADILNDLQGFIGCRQYADKSCFPNEESDLSPYSNSAWLNDYSINYHQLQNLTKRDKGLYDRLKRDNNLPHQIWCVWCDQMWIEFLGIEKAACRPVSFADAFPLRLWICQSVPYFFGEKDRTETPSSSSSAEMVEVATESGDAEDIKLNKMEIVYEANTGNFSPRSQRKVGPNNSVYSPRQSGSDTSECSESGLRSPRHTAVRGKVFHKKQNKSKFYDDITSTADKVDNTNSIRISHSDGDLLPNPHNDRCETNSLHIFNPGCDRDQDPPPPYTPNGYSAAGGSLSSSIASLPPAYDTVADEIPGEVEKPVINDFVNDDEPFSAEKASIAMLLSIKKTVQIQLDHFQMLFLIRLSEVAASVVERIGLDNELCENERKLSLNQWVDVEHVNKPEESIVINVSIPNVVVDIVLFPCIGIDPIQTFSLPDRIEYDKTEKNINISTEHDLPLRRISPSKPITPTGNLAVSDFNCKPDLKQDSIRLEESTISKNPLAVLPYTSSLQNYACELSGSLGGSTKLLSNHEYDPTLKEVSDVGIQVGNSLMGANLIPNPENQLVSVLRIKAGLITIGIQSQAADSVVKFAAETLVLNELGNLKYGKVLDPRGIVLSENPKEKQAVNMDPLTGEAMLKLRLITGPRAEELAKDGGELGFADIRVTSLAAALLMSTVDNLTEFAEDEFVLPTMPFVVNISRSDILLYDDKPRRYKSAIKLPPMQVLIDELLVLRDSHGVISVKQANKDTETIPGLSDQVAVSISQRVHSASVNSTLIAESINQQVDALIGENGRLLEDLKVVNAKVNGLHSERESLLKVIDKLQQELMWSNRENDDLQNRVRSLSLSKHRADFL